MTETTAKAAEHRLHPTALSEALALFQLETGNEFSSLADVEASERGLQYYVTGGDESCKYGSAINSKHERALAHDHEAQSIYKRLPVDVKKKWKAVWSVTRDFKHTKVRKISKNSHTVSTKDKGTFMTIYSVAERLGGWKHAACQEGAFRYCSKCIQVSKS